MAEDNLHASRDFFKEITTEILQLRLVAQHLQTFIDRARVRGSRVGDNHLLLILDQLESFLSVISESSDRLEKIGMGVRLQIL